MAEDMMSTETILPRSKLVKSQLMMEESTKLDKLYLLRGNITQDMTRMILEHRPKQSWNSSLKKWMSLECLTTL
mgnify:CR=1 FL=1